MKPDFQLIGHRGARARHPENTIEGYKACLSSGIASFETDIALTADGVPVLHHDAQLNAAMTRDRAGNWVRISDSPFIRDIRFEALQDYNVGAIRPGSALVAQFPDQVGLHNARVPRLSELLTLPCEQLFIELKIYGTHPEWTASPDEMVRAVLRDISDAGAASRVTLQSFHWDTVRLCRELAPHIPRAWLTAADTLAASESWTLSTAESSGVPEAIVKEGGGTWTPKHTDLTEEDLRQAHAKGLRVAPWTVNDPKIAVRLAGWGVDGVITDDPLAIRAALHEAFPQ